MSCCKMNELCIKFVIAALISFGTTVFACTMLLLDRFENTAMTSFCTSLIGMNLTYWCDSPQATQRSSNSNTIL